jgi:hypothetical protein
MHLNQNSGCPILTTLVSSLGWVIVCGSKRPPCSNLTQEAR